MSKYKVVICDDAAFIRTRLAKLIESHFPEASIAGNYPDGEDVFKHLKNEPIDILITDICMENIDGLTVTKYIYEKKLHTKVIIITGYQDFEYAQKALKYHTCALITKPICTDELITAVKEAIQSLRDSLAAATEQSHHFVNQHKQSEQLLQLYLSGKISYTDLSSYELLHNAEKFNDTGYIVNFYIPETSVRSPAESWNDLVLVQNEDFKIYSLSCCSSAASYIVLITNNPQSCREKLESVISDTIKTISLFNNTNCSYSIFELNTVKALFHTESFKEYSKYMSAVSNNEPINLHQVISSISDKFSNDEYKIVLSQFLVYTANRYPEFDLRIFYNRAKQIGNGESGKDVFSELHKSITHLESENHVFSELIIQYIYNNISDKDLSLEKVSKHFNYSPEHFSRKFKKALNITFQNYLANLRIEEAKKLLENSPLSIIAVSKKIGFKDPAYFSKKFKKKTGFLPKDWRNK